ncbi:M24 family metallopeptidase [Massilia forsythiae]|uniref:M24 family metallopeptidase n=2 Tax=Massilia forsythiae TaxID=2728020 RepID=A0A7Z2W1E7_9BURK|nr:M24 family metallopeptidase [Massilia forsythiae]
MASGVADPARALDAAGKLALLREALGREGAGAIRLRGPDWFAWVTGGGDAGPGASFDAGAAEVLVTHDEACILTDETEGERLRREQVPSGFGFHSAPWTESDLGETYVLGAAAGKAVLADRPGPLERPLPAALRQQRMVLDERARQDYRELGRDAAAAVGEVLRAARPAWSERQLAGAAARALWSRGIQPVMLLATGERRVPPFCQAPPSGDAIGKRAGLSVCARRRGLYASLTRSVAFGALDDRERIAQEALLRVEATALDAVRAGVSLSAVYHALDAAYRHADRLDAIRRHRQGGVTGYAACELAAGPSTATGLEQGMAIALRPGFDCFKIEDTFLLGADGLELLTPDPRWPATDVRGRARPLWLETT